MSSQRSDPVTEAMVTARRRPEMLTQHQAAILSVVCEEYRMVVGYGSLKSVVCARVRALRAIVERWISNESEGWK